ncbi:hypothetical protein STCU_01386 [Strigomonas culicis]|uniref:RRM domain-containing protein n=1 Tax=Strigomonas culicis TaxID=28005 RepID=S9W666_9TRYP|nr:hypothetical protein STCU_01386 [Strigomonas culicis]|eukprot:EPY34716.1 hypothetical protein STCU_01386 [Strigomonas culicis]
MWTALDGLSPCHSIVSDSSSWSTAEPTAGGDVSSFLSRTGDDSREDGASFGFHCKFWVRVKYLEENTSESALKKMFYPYGADEAFTSVENGEFRGFVGFEVDCMAALASEKMNEFIPCGQSQALQVHVVDMDEVLVARTRSVAQKKKVRTFILEKSPAGAAAELANQVKCSSIQALVPLLSSVSIYLSAGDRQTQFVKDELFKLLLVQIVEGSDRSVCANCGTASRFFFLLRYALGRSLSTGD